MHLTSLLSWPALFSYAIEITLILLLSVLFFGLMSALTYAILHLARLTENKKIILRSLGLLSASMLIIQLVGTLIWRTVIENHFVKEADDWIAFLTFRPLHWNTVFAGLAQTYHEPLAPLFTTGQVANLYFGLTILLIAVGGAVPAFFLWKKTKQTEVMLLSFIFVMLELVWLGVFSLVAR